ANVKMQVDTSREESVTYLVEGCQLGQVRMRPGTGLLQIVHLDEDILLPTRRSGKSYKSTILCVVVAMILLPDVQQAIVITVLYIHFEDDGSPRCAALVGVGGYDCRCRGRVVAVYQAPVLIWCPGRIIPGAVIEAGKGSLTRVERRKELAVEIHGLEFIALAVAYNVSDLRHWRCCDRRLDETLNGVVYVF